MFFFFFFFFFLDKKVKKWQKKSKNVNISSKIFKILLKNITISGIMKMNKSIT